MSAKFGWARQDSLPLGVARGRVSISLEATALDDEQAFGPPVA
jgi:hypothetical protein